MAQKKLSSSPQSSATKPNTKLVLVRREPVFYLKFNGITAKKKNEKIILAHAYRAIVLAALPLNFAQLNSLKPNDKQLIANN